MLKIWGRISSINVQKVVWCARECGVAFDRIDAGGSFGVVNTPEYRAINPNAKVPTIDDDGFVLWESNAIVRYLAARYAPGSLCPGGLAERADADRWMDWAAVEHTRSVRRHGRPPSAHSTASLPASASCILRWSCSVPAQIASPGRGASASTWRV